MPAETATAPVLEVPQLQKAKPVLTVISNHSDDAKKALQDCLHAVGCVMNVLSDGQYQSGPEAKIYSPSEYANCKGLALEKGYVEPNNPKLSTVTSVLVETVRLLSTSDLNTQQLSALKSKLEKA